jgi:hypothetical protein
MLSSSLRAGTMTVTRSLEGVLLEDEPPRGFELCVVMCSSPRRRVKVFSFQPTVTRGERTWSRNGPPTSADTSGAPESLIRSAKRTH